MEQKEEMLLAGNKFDCLVNQVNELPFSALEGGKVLVTGGHFVAGPKPLLNCGTLTSLQVAAIAYKRLLSKNINASLGILVNDIGATCSATGCSLVGSSFNRETFEFPECYCDTLSAMEIEISDVSIFWEKKMRNRGQKVLRQRVGRDESIKVIEGESWLLTRDSDGLEDDYLLARNSPHCPSGTPACPLIMGGYSLEQDRQGYLSSLHYYYIGEDNYTNIPNYLQIEKGVRVGQFFGSRTNIRNVYFTSVDVFVGNGELGK